MTVDTEAGMVAHSQCWGQPAWSAAQCTSQCMLQSLWMDGVQRSP